MLTQLLLTRSTAGFAVAEQSRCLFSNCQGQHKPEHQSQQVDCTQEIHSSGGKTIFWCFYLQLKQDLTMSDPITIFHHTGFRSEAGDNFQSVSHPLCSYRHRNTSQKILFA